MEERMKPPTDMFGNTSSTFSTFGPGSCVYVKKSSKDETSKSSRDAQNYEDQGFVDFDDEITSEEEDADRKTTIGCALIDRKTCNKFLISTSHHLRHIDQQTLFLTQTYENDNINERDLAEEHQAYFGPYKNILIDVLLLPMPDNFFANAFVDMSVPDPADTSHKIMLNIYTGAIKDLIGTRVYKIGAGSGFTTGFIAQCEHHIKVKNELCTVFLIQPDSNSNEQVFASKGDSGSLVYCKHPKTQDYIALGLIVGREIDPKGKLLCCSPLGAIWKYLLEQHDLDLEVYSPVTNCKDMHLPPRNKSQIRKPLYSFELNTRKKSFADLHELGDTDYSLRYLPNRNYERSELEDFFDKRISDINSGFRTLPGFVYSLQLPSNENTIFICMDEAKREIGEIFLKLWFDDCANIFPVYITPHEELVCSDCEQMGCSSQTGLSNSWNPQTFVGPGSPIAVLETREWEHFRKLNGLKKTIEDVREFCKKSQDENKRNSENSADELRCFFKRWTLAGHVCSCTNGEYKLLTVAHPLRNRPVDKYLTFITETGGNNQHPQLVVLGQRFDDQYREEETVDIALIDLDTDFEKNLLKNKLKESCGPNYFSAKPRIDHGNPCQVLGGPVTKNGKSGHSYGQIVGSERLFITTRTRRSVNAVNAFAVVTNETECRVIRRFGEPGDSGALVHQTQRVVDEPYAYGMVWRNCWGIRNELTKMLGGATVCVSLAHCLIELKPAINDMFVFPEQNNV